MSITRDIIPPLFLYFVAWYAIISAYFASKMRFIYDFTEKTCIFAIFLVPLRRKGICPFAAPGVGSALLVLTRTALQSHKGAGQVTSQVLRFLCPTTCLFVLKACLFV